MAIPSLTGYLGPLPLWTWIALGGGGLYLYEKHKGSAAGGTGILSGVLGTSDSAGAATNTEASGPADNDAWAQDAINSLIAQGYDGLQATSAINSYLDGGTLDPSYNSLISAAIKNTGAPPDITPTASAPIMPTPTQPVGTTTGSGAKPVGSSSSTTTKKTTSAPATPTKAPAFTTYKIKSGDTLSAIAKKNGTTVSALASYNGIKNPNLIYAGHSLKIPTAAAKKK